MCLWPFGLNFWLFPNLFDEDLGISDSFKPVVSCSVAEREEWPYRLGGVVALAAFAYWLHTQPTEFDDFVRASQKFKDDLFDGTLLSDVSQEDKDNIDNPKRMPTVEELEKMSLEDEEEGKTDDMISELIKEDEEEADRLFQEQQEAEEAERKEFRAQRKEDEKKKAKEEKGSGSD